MNKRRLSCRCSIHTHHRRKVNPARFALNLAALDGINPRDPGPIDWPAVSSR